MSTPEDEKNKMSATQPQPDPSPVPDPKPELPEEIPGFPITTESGGSGSSTGG